MNTARDRQIEEIRITENMIRSTSSKKRKHDLNKHLGRLYAELKEYDSYRFKKE